MLLSLMGDVENCTFLSHEKGSGLFRSLVLLSSSRCHLQLPNPVTTPHRHSDDVNHGGRCPPIQWCRVCKGGSADGTRSPDRDTRAKLNSEEQGEQSEQGWRMCHVCRGRRGALRRSAALSLFELFCFPSH
ncbi:hypothetical protein E2C01_011349 [Portunus trituberculatus]|uniref:Uncharacterized protein n=1 Tax=Portunus trituberculatus TaxID=210409 RepID=A0A5B7DB56_PORTR|nr:hypothetical protein [Portunus trituberculatus]